MFEYTSKGEYGEIEYDDIVEQLDTIVESYGDEPYELLLAEPSWEDKCNIEAIQEVKDYHAYGTIFVPAENLRQYVEAKIDEALGSVKRNIELGVWPFNFVKVDIEAAVEATLAVAERSMTVEFDDDSYVAIDPDELAEAK
jgi:hypothetical protein